MAQSPGIPYQAVLLDKNTGSQLPGMDDHSFVMCLVSLRAIFDVDGKEYEEIQQSTPWSYLT